MKLPTSEKTEIFTMRISKKNKLQLEDLAKKRKIGNNSSEVIRNLIESAHSKKFFY